MASKNDYIIVQEKKDKGTKKIFLLFFGILAFIAIYFPLFGANMRYQTGSLLSQTFDIIGKLCIAIGGIMVVWGLLNLLCRRSMGGAALMIMGAILLFIGGWFAAPGTIGMMTTGKEVPKGYH